jgi:hypothetical protein
MLLAHSTTAGNAVGAGTLNTRQKRRYLIRRMCYDRQKNLHTLSRARSSRKGRNSLKFLNSRWFETVTLHVSGVNLAKFLQASCRMQQCHELFAGQLKL